MMKLQTAVDVPSGFRMSLSEGTMVLGSCFADNVGALLSSGGFNVLTNPTGTLYNPLSIESALSRIASGKHFDTADTVRMGAGTDLICSFHHHTSFARESVEDFLGNANACLDRAAAFWHDCGTVIITLGTAYCWFHDSEVVSNCLKRPSREFERRLLSLKETEDALRRIISLCTGKRIIWTVSPIRHLSDGAHNNNLSKSTLLLSTQAVLRDNDLYFPSYEIIMDELRDYRFYAEDMTHPTAQAVHYVYERFLDCVLSTDKEREKVMDNHKASRKQAHRPITRQ